MIVKPQLTDDQCHTEEGVYSIGTEDIWKTHITDKSSLLSRLLRVRTVTNSL